MKVFEILRDDVKQVTESQILERMSKFDWKYEFSDDITRITWGQRELELIENLVYQFWKTQPEKAISLWNKNSPEGLADTTIVPSFILRLKEQDK